MQQLDSKLILPKNDKQTKLYYSSEYKKGILLLILANTLFAVQVLQIKLMKNYYKTEYNFFAFYTQRCIGLLIVLFFSYSKSLLKEFFLLSRETHLLLTGRSTCIILNFVFFFEAFNYIRVSTVQCISSLSPIFLTILAALVLKEKIILRYWIGLILCLLGALLIISNEKSSSSITNENKLFGVFICLFNPIFYSIMLLLIKMLTNRKVNLMHMQMTTSLYGIPIALLILVFSGKLYIVINLSMLFWSMLNGIMIWYVFVFIQMGYERVELSATTPISYITLVWTFAIGTIVFKEEIYLTDIIGSLTIIGFNIYHSCIPV